MKKEIYQELRDAILTCPEITDVRIWTSATDDQDLLGRLPIVFIEFTNISYNTGMDQMQEVESPAFRLHLIYKALDHSDTLIFDISQNIYKAIHSKGYHRTRELAKYGPDETIDWQIEIEGPRFVDTDAKTKMITIDAPPVTITIPAT